jgi:hypothetical protein
MAEPSKIACKIKGNPVEFPNDLVLTNTANTASRPLPKGTRIRWSIPKFSQQGFHVLKESLKPGASVFLSNVLPTGVEPRNSCEATLAPLLLEKK